MRPFFLIACALFLLGCSKEIAKNKAIDGSWTVDKFSLMNYQGLKQEIQPTGTIQFTADSKNSKTGSYNFQLYFDFDGQPLNFVEVGTYEISNKNLMHMKSSQEVEREATVVYTTKKDMILDMPNVSYLGYYFVLKRQ